MLYRDWVSKPHYEIVNTEDNSLVIRCLGSLRTSDQNITDYDQNLEIVSDETGIPFRALHAELITAFEDWTTQKQEEHD